MLLKEFQRFFDKESLLKEQSLLRPPLSPPLAAQLAAEQQNDLAQPFNKVKRIDKP